MKRIIITAGAALLAAIPVTMGLVGNTSFAQSVPVRVPSQATMVDDKGGLSNHVEPGDDNGGATTHVEPGDDSSSTSGSGKDDNGGDTSGKGGTDDGDGHS